MKKVYALILTAFAGVAAGAQVNVTFNVDMTDQTVSPNGVHLAGNFQDVNYDGTLENPDLVNWSPNTYQMTDADMDNVYSVTLTLVAERYEFKFINDNNWGPGEDPIPAACQVGNGTSNREIWVGESDASYTVCWGSCAPCGEKTVRFRVDMSMVDVGVNPVGVHVAGSFQGWNPGGTQLSDPDGNLIFEGYYNVGSAESIQYKFLNGNDWPFVEGVPSECGVGNDLNREVMLTDANTLLEAVCFGGCTTCTQPTQVTFRVNMSLQTVSPNGVHVAGAFQTPDDWSPGDPNYEMTDADADGIYELTTAIMPGTWSYKFVNGNAWDGADNDNESLPAECNVGGNRQIVVGSEALDVEFCYEQCTSTCIADPDPADITFRCDMSQTTVDPNGLWMIGNFTSPQWQGGAVQMTDIDADNVYECTVTVGGPADIQYKFVNGDVNGTNVEENAGIMDCGIANGIGGYNRIHTRSGVAEALDVVCFNSCEACIVSVQETDIVGSVKAFPVPAEGTLTVSFDNLTPQNIVVRMINNIGQVVAVQNLGIVPTGTRNVQFDVQSLSTGLYAIELSNGMANEVIQITVK